jgi:hypothetical protein
VSTFEELRAGYKIITSFLITKNVNVHTFTISALSGLNFILFSKPQFRREASSGRKSSVIGNFVAGVELTEKEKLEL